MLDQYSRHVLACRLGSTRDSRLTQAAVEAAFRRRGQPQENILKDLGTIERLFGQTWIVDPAPFAGAFEKWRTFKSEYERWAVSGMTVNERLHALGLLSAFEEACWLTTG